MREHLLSHPLDQRLLGVYIKSSPNPGEIMLSASKDTRQIIPWMNTIAHSHDSDLIALSSHWHQASSIVTCTGDIATIGSHVLIKTDRVRSI